MALVALPILAMVALSLTPVLMREGWPFNHEHLTWKFRMFGFADHLQQGDWMPIWSSEDSFGLGSPIFLYYHKLFNYLAGGVYLVFGHVKLAVVSSIAALLVWGSAGLYLCAREIGLPRAQSAFIASTLPVQSYTLADWLIRGALAEFSAIMLIPWLLFSLLTMLRTHRASPWLLVSVGLMALAHSVIAYFAVVTFLVAWVLILLTASRPELIRLVGTLSLYGLALLACVLPLWLIHIQIADSFDLSPFLTDYYRVENHFQSLGGHYIYGDWLWGQEWDQTNLQLNAATTLGMLFALGLAAREIWQRRTRSALPLVFLLVSLLAYVLLLTKLSAFLYSWVPGFEYLQFPWRLLGFIQVLILLLVAWGLVDLRARGAQRGARWACGLFFILSALGTKSLHPITYDWYDAAALEARAMPGASPGAMGSGEYLPRIFDASLETDENLQPHPFDRITPRLRSLAARGVELLPVAGPTDEATLEPAPCTVISQSARTHEQTVFVYQVSCDRASILIFPQIYSGLERATLASGETLDPNSANEIRTATFRLNEDPRVRVQVPPGRVTASLELPQLSARSLLGALPGGEPSDPDKEEPTRDAGPLSR